MMRLAGTVGRLPRYLRLARALFDDPAVPRARKVALAAGIGYVLMPFDLIPGIIPIAGQLDDLAALLLGLRHALRGTPPSVARGHLDRLDLTESDLDADIANVGAAAGWLARKTVSFSRKALIGAVALARRAGAMVASRA
jgi:uncharacterized membrane protein YkvA (DUF1232 family)